ncbi:NAD(P)H-hydrate dehydratase [Nesterenkonia sp. MY13]|uniref:Bifunctional NAD(P)H-hydrate repair enzyme n=1 Tax=Nesterenkonia sedimenti TaxID=1463632 RepID=A0A7X8YCY6_9MICC|nr:NAD(P)H-hydrate dehydratase [Nesterenkonia sedimenti]NLS09098.1 NAD(P)H-hydrate dehydratase [Nesterenkonia sedimenti]
MRRQQIELMRVYTGEQIRDAEKPLLDAGEGPTLMRRAAYGLAQHTVAVLDGPVYGAKVTGLIGSGNNGGDGLYALAFLVRRGAQVHAVLTRQRAHPQALEAFQAAGGRITSSIPAGTQVLIDSMLGTGFTGEFTRPEIPGLAGALDDAAVIACDLPSGINADTGAAGEAVIPADHTVTFGGLKQGLLAGRGGTLSGNLHTVDIGLGPHLPKTPVHMVTGSAPGAGRAAAATWTVGNPPRVDDHKYSRGVVHVLAGSKQYPGAAQLTVAAALRTGAGMVTLQAPASVSHQVLSRWPEVVSTPAGQSVPAVEKAAAVVIGPGIGAGETRLAEAEGVLEQCLETGTACVLDASGLGLIRNQLRRRDGLNKNVLITPHLGEARQIAKTLRDRVLTTLLQTDSPRVDPVEAARRIAGRLDCSVLLKGATTVIASPDGDVLLHRAGDFDAGGAPGLATAGSGDVLSGILGAVAARSRSWLQVAAAGASIHTAAAGHIDPDGRGRFSASGLIEAIPHV